MPFISYGQNFEDVILWRALKNVEKGFYIDVGAWEPELDSVTKAFYDRGWSGVNIEPSSQYFEKLLIQRPRDTNIQAIASSFEGEAKFFEVENSGLSSVNSELANEALNSHHSKVTEVMRPSITLNSLISKFNVTDVHFLKIDAEGSEEQVLLGIDLGIYRPWIIVIESTYPGHPEIMVDGWKSYLLNHRYVESYFDGVNSFFVKNELVNLIPKLAHPPNIYDDFIRSSEYHLQQENLALKNELNDLYNSNSITITRPLRAVAAWYRKNKKITRRSLKLTLNTVMDFSKTKRWLKMRFPHIWEFFKKYYRIPTGVPVSQIRVPLTEASVINSIVNDLETAIIGRGENEISN